MGDPLLTIHDLARHLGIKARTLKRLMAEDSDFPRPIKVSRGDRWIPREVEEWELLQKMKARLAGPWPNLDNRGHSGTSAPPAENHPSRKADRR